MNKKFYIYILFFLSVTKAEAQQNCNLACNGGADSTFITSSQTFVDSSQFPCWRTTSPDGLMEVWANGFNGVPSYSGTQFIELNAYYVSTLYQNITVTAGASLTISFAHRGRAGTDTMSVSVGPVGGPYTTLGYFADGTTAWGYYTVNYTVPGNLGNYYSLRFNSIYAAMNNPGIGNFLDAVTVCQSEPQTQICDLICNGDADSTFITSSVAFIDSSQLLCWHTTSPDGIMEVWHSGYAGVPSYSGSQFIEINAYFFATLYQNITVTPGSGLTISFAHRGRGGIDTMSVSVGPVGGPYTTLGYYGDGSTAWGYYTVNYTVPGNQGNYYSVRFNSIYAALGNPSIGNFLDAVTVCQSEGKPTGTEEITDENYFSVFPNPAADGSVTIFCPQSNTNFSYKICDSFGKIIRDGKNNGGNLLTVDISAFVPSVYFIILNSEKRNYTRKIIKL